METLVAFNQPLNRMRSILVPYPRPAGGKAHGGRAVSEGVVGNPISVDLLRAASRSESFPKDWSLERTQAALERYRKFLLLAAKNPGRAIAPTRDIDEFWHLHMLHPKAYADDCQRLLGYILDHDGGFGKDPEELPVLAQHFEQTALMWQTAYGESYVGVEAGAASGDLTKCWHNCQSRCHQACKSN